MSDRSQSAYSQKAGQRDETAVVVATIEAQREKYVGILPSDVSWGEFKNAFLIAVQRNWRLLEADRASLWLALQDCAACGLRPDGREAALVIFGDDEEDEAGNRIPSKANQKKKVVLLPMVWGLARLVQNTGDVADLRARCIYRGEHFRNWEEDGAEHYEYQKNTDPDFDDAPDKIVGAFAVVQFKGGSWTMDHLSRAQIDRRRAISRAKKGPWGPWYDEQSCKTVLKHLFKRLRKSRELQRISDILDRDASLPNTIDGEKPTEVGKAAQLGAPDPLSNEFRGFAPAGEKVAAGAKAPSAAAAQGSASTLPAQADAGTPVGGNGAQQPQNGGNGGAPTAPEFWPSDEVGEPIEEHGEPLVFRNAMAFAEWFAERYAMSSNREALRENNMDAIADAGADAAALKVITETLDRRETASAQGDWGAVLIPRTPGGKEHWPNYAAACGEAIAACPDLAAIDAWVKANVPVYGGKAIEAKIARHLAGRRAEIEKASRPAEPAASEKPDPDVTWAAAIIADLQNMMGPNEALGLARTIEVRMARLRSEKPELFAEVKAAFDAAAGAP